MRKVPQMASQTSWPGSEDSATTVHIENEAVSEHQHRVVVADPRDADRRPSTSKRED
jgi:hypothetical protein